MDTIRIAVCQINTTVGDLLGNTQKILFCFEEAKQNEADIIVFPELAVTGYPPEDLLFNPDFIKQNLKFITKIKSQSKGMIGIIGFVDSSKDAIYNSAAVVCNDRLVYAYHKINLPNYSVFDEKRYFKAGDKNVVLKAKGFSFAVNICEDIWVKESIKEQKILKNIDFLINISASPYYFGKTKEREHIISLKAKEYNIPIVYCNLIGGQDELVFDGRSAAFNNKGKREIEAKAFEEDIIFFDLKLEHKNTKAKAGSINIDYKIKTKIKQLECTQSKDLEGAEEIYSALVLGLRDYAEKNNFKKVSLGLSGGIDSALAVCIAVDAVGRENVLAVSMPSRYSSLETQADAETLAGNLGVRLVKIPIDNIFNSYLDAFLVHFKEMPQDITEENIQARIRGNLLMAFSNKFGYLVLTTGNKSETSVGYCTLYGDMAGGFSVIKDVSKRLVYELASYRNLREKKEIIPKSIIARAPTAELRPNQKDQDSLPPYELLDTIIDLYIEKNEPLGYIIKKVKDKELAKKVLNMIDLSEYKRRQAPIGVKITPLSFGKDRRMPITNKFGG